MFDAFELRTNADEVKRFSGAITAALVVMGVGIVALVVFGNRPIAETLKAKQVDVSFRPPPPPPEPVKLENPPPPPPPKKVAMVTPPPTPAPVLEAPAPAPAAAAMVAPKEAPKTAAPESDKAVAAINVAVGGTGDGSGTAVGGGSHAEEDDSPAPVAVSAAASGPVNLPEDADPPEPSEENAQPEYPESARTTGQEARVVLKIVVEATGAVGRIQVLKGEEPFVSAALAAVRTWKYEPARLEGNAIAVFKIVDLKFQLRE